MSRQDPSAATGMLPYEPTRCTCEHLITFHKLSESGQRVACSASTCPCRRFTEEAP